MKEAYRDILERISEEPKWYDANGCPRYGDFSPDKCPNIYAREAVLLRISCQECGRHFDVELHSDIYSRGMAEALRMWQDKAKRGDKNNWPPIHYGDPPCHGCVGDTMNCNDERILEFWVKEDFDWKRMPELEIDFCEISDYGFKGILKDRENGCKKT
ncbi:MAG TPA: hypothetical protein HPP87_04610 [Planctomycetes bacterium]|nr:hypothetical protein [Planctomycetota bacterium]HIJ70629.1 hypothetical protein [Planctomycetota bacterium]